MIHQRYKDIYFLSVKKVTFPNYVLRKYLLPIKPQNGHGVHLHVGCGEKYLTGFLNIDGNRLRKLDLWLDIRNGLPFHTGSVDSIYTSQMLEHFFTDELGKILMECLRVLKPAGGIRISVPNLRNAIIAYIENKSSWFSHWPHDRKSVGGRFSNFIFCDGQHRNAFDFDYFVELLTSAGFSEIVETKPACSRLYNEEVLRHCEAEQFPECPHSLYIEAFK